MMARKSVTAAVASHSVLSSSTTKHNTKEDANAVIYIYDIKTGNVEKGAEVDGRFNFDMIRVIEND